jgi:competence ComEA-like helix-hairpin-helix protein
MVLTTLVYLALAAKVPNLPPGKGKAIVQRDCTGCHALKVVTSKHASPEQWSALVNQMVSRGADVPDEEIETVVEYLAKNFGPAKPIPATGAPHHREPLLNVNKATAAQLAGALGLPVEQSRAIVSYREQNGSFKQWHDLTKVPGVETGRIERYKDRLIF